MYRGKPTDTRKDGKAFVYGAIAKFNDQRFIFPEGGGVLSKDESGNHWNAFGLIEVSLSSVGRFTDHDGIHEGDIVKAEYSCSFSDHTITGIVRYEEASAAWYLDQGSISIPLMQLTSGTTRILGNTSDNPELAK